MNDDAARKFLNSEKVNVIQGQKKDLNQVQDQLSAAVVEQDRKLAVQFAIDLITWPMS